MTNAIPLIVTPQGDGTGRASRLTAAEYPAMLAELTKYLDPFSLLVSGASEGAGVAGLTLAENALLGRVGSGAPGSVTAAQISQMIGLADLLAAKSDLGHSHAFGGVAVDIDWTTLADDRILARVAGGYIWIDIPSGGTGGAGLQNPLTGNLDIAEFEIVSGAQSLISFSGGKIYIGGQELLDALIENATEGQVPRFNATTGKWENAAQKVGDVVGETVGKWLQVGPDKQLVEVDAPAGGSASGASGVTYPEGPTNFDTFRQSESLDRSVFRDDLPIKQADADVDELDGWISRGTRSITTNRRDLDLKTASAYIFGDGYSAGFYFPKAAVISRFDITFGAVTSGNVTFRVNTGNSGVSVVHTVNIASAFAHSSEPWILVPADSMLSLHGASFANATPELSVALELRDYVAPTEPTPV